MLSIKPEARVDEIRPKVPRAMRSKPWVRVARKPAASMIPPKVSAQRISQTVPSIPYMPLPLSKSLSMGWSMAICVLPYMACMLPSYQALGPLWPAISAIMCG